ncbi:MAG: GrpB family protein [Candidatus Eremiobacteraeota bacterium]|nr:GrpB family protein [Candidatus Eremiobacteraeota bacterium]MCW5869659.1 GrpB family protein [Candidatus Eremiobacteraeota bacterium]
MSTKVELLDHRGDWAEQAVREAERFAAALGRDRRLIGIHHIGSTSIPGIQAKPIIDLLPEVTSLEWLDEMQPQIEAAGFEYWGDYGIPRRRFCPQTGGDGWRRVNVHCFLSGDEQLVRHLAFRDYLRAHPEMARDYERIKQACAERYREDAYGYTDCKSAWIQATQAAALEWWARRPEGADSRPSWAPPEEG